MEENNNPPPTWDPPTGAQMGPSPVFKPEDNTRRDELYNRLQALKIEQAAIEEELMQILAVREIPKPTPLTPQQRIDAIES